MNPLLELINHLLAAWLAEQPGGKAWALRELKMDSTGGILVARLDHPKCRGEIAARLVVSPPEGTRQTLSLKIEQWPDSIPPELKPFKNLLQKARLSLELDFSE